MNKNIPYLIGSIFILSGTILLGMMHIAIAMYVPTMAGWENPPGKFTTVMNDIMGWFPYVLSITLILIGIFAIWNTLRKHNARG